MTFEERMERLAERHEALAQTVENAQRDLVAAGSHRGARPRHDAKPDGQASGADGCPTRADPHKQPPARVLDGLLLATDRVLKATGHVVLVAGRYDARISTLEK